MQGPEKLNQDCSSLPHTGRLTDEHEDFEYMVRVVDTEQNESLQVDCSGRRMKLALVSTRTSKAAWGVTSLLPRAASTASENQLRAACKWRAEGEKGEVVG